MKKLIYIAYIDKNKEVGVFKKVNAQCNEFSKYYETILIYKNENNICIKNFNESAINEFKNVLDITYDTKIKKIKNISVFNHFVKELISNEHPQILYIRKYNLLKSGIKIIKNYKLCSPKYVIYEIPTYPYKEELIINKRYLTYLLSKSFDDYMSRTADLLTVILGKEVKLHSKKYMPIFNGIDINEINIKIQNNINKNVINIVGIANISFWHGYDRVIEGLKNYYNINENHKIIVNFHIVGEGAQLDDLKKLAYRYNLNDYVIFHGVTIGKQLDKIIDYCDIAIGSIANHRKGLTKDSALKNREYCARGIPFIIASKDNSFKNFKYIHKISADEVPVNIEELIDFYNNIKDQDYINEMREYAKNNLTWEAVMQPVVKAIEKNFNNESISY